VPSGGFGGKLPPAPDLPSGAPPTTIVSTTTEHDWRVWWSYNREWYLASRLRGTPVSGTRVDANDGLTRKKLRDEVLTPILLDALEDKSHHVREAAAVALGKFGNREFNIPLTRRSDAPREKFLSTRDACLYAMGLLRLPENRAYLTSVAADKRRPLLARSIELTSFALDDTRRSVETLKWHLEYHRSSLRFKADAMPTVSEEDRRRFSAHLLGFVDKEFDVDDLLYRAVLGSRRWTEGTQGLAATALGRRRARDYRGQLLRLVHDRESPRALQRSIPIALGLMLRRTDEDEIRELGRIAKDFKRRPVVRHFAIMALARIGGKLPAEILIGHLRDNVYNDAQERGFAYLALGILGMQSKDAREQLMVEFERTGSATERAPLALALGIARHKEAIPVTVKYIEKASSGGAGADVLAYGTLALGLHGRKECLAPVKKVLGKYRIPRIQANAAIALVLLERNQAMGELQPILEESGNATTRGAIMMAIGMIPSPEMKIVKVLKEQYERDGNPDVVRALAVVGLGAIGDPDGVPMSVRFVRGYNYLIRCAAIDLIASIL